MVIEPDRQFQKVDDIAELFPGLPDKLDSVDGSGSLVVVSDVCARELVLVGASVLLGKSDIDGECAMVIWHDDDDVTTPPVCVEFSFKYEDNEEDYRGTVARDAHDVLHAIHTRLQD